MGAAVAARRSGSLVGPLFAGALLTVGRTPSQVLIGVVPIVLASGLCVALLTRYGLGPYASSESAASPVANAYHPSRRLEGSRFYEFALIKASVHLGRESARCT